jgi:homoserine kinase type II
VHGDFWDNNVLFASNRIAAVLDFGFMAERPRVDDLALPFWFYLLEPGRGLPTSADQKVLRELIDAYDGASRAPLSTIERQSIPLAIARQPAWSIGRWVVDLEEGQAIRHALSAASELPVAQAIVDNVNAWQEALLHQSGAMTTRPASQATTLRPDLAI